jgi:ketosteroid isomerase-like protein
MKVNIFITSLLFFIVVGCTSKQSDQLTQQQKDQIKSEVKTVIDSIFAKFARLDVVGALQYYSPELVVVRDTSLMPYQTIKKFWIDIDNSIATVKWTTVHWECIVLTKDFVISSWIGKMEFLTKSGDKVTCDPQGYTDVLKKVDGQWKDIYEHSSGILVTQKADKE